MSETAQRLLGGGTGGGSGVVPRSRLRRGIRFADQGTVHAISLKKAVNPTFGTKNRTLYAQGGLVCRSQSGAVLDVRDP